MTSSSEPSVNVGQGQSDWECLWPGGQPSVQPHMPPPRRRLPRWALPVVAGLGVAANGFRLGLASSDHSLLSSVLVGAGLLLLTLGLIAWAAHRARLRTGASLPARATWATASGALAAAVVIALMFGVFGRELGNGLVPEEPSILGAPGYTTLTGPEGKPLPVGRPWGRPCEPIVIVAAAHVPDLAYTEIQEATEKARAAGVDVTVADRRFHWQPTDLYPTGLTNANVRFVVISANATSSPRLPDGNPEHIGFTWDTTVAADGRHEVLTSLEGVLYLKNLGQEGAAYGVAARQFIAISQGVGGSTTPGSAIAQGTTVASYSSGDLAAMRRMSGCHFEPT